MLRKAQTRRSRVTSWESKEFISYEIRKFGRVFLTRLQELGSHGEDNISYFFGGNAFRPCQRRAFGVSGFTVVATLSNVMRQGTTTWIKEECCC